MEITDMYYDEYMKYVDEIYYKPREVAIQKFDEKYGKVIDWTEFCCGGWIYKRAKGYEEHRNDCGIFIYKIDEDEKKHVLVEFIPTLLPLNPDQFLYLNEEEELREREKQRNLELQEKAKLSKPSLIDKLCNWLWQLYKK